MRLERSVWLGEVGTDKRPVKRLDLRRLCPRSSRSSRKSSSCRVIDGRLASGDAAALLGALPPNEVIDHRLPLPLPLTLLKLAPSVAALLPVLLRRE